MKTLFFPIGISGSGKSYYLKNRFLSDFKEVADYLLEKGLTLADITVSPDDIRRELFGDVNDIINGYYVWIVANDRLKEKISTYGYGVLDATGVSGKDRRKFLKNYEGVKKIALVFEPNVELSNERIYNDISTNVDRSNVSPEVVDRQYNSFKNSVIKNDKWDGLWNKVAKKKASENLRTEFDVVFIV